MNVVSPLQHEFYNTYTKSSSWQEYNSDPLKLLYQSDEMKTQLKSGRYTALRQL